MEMCLEDQQFGKFLLCLDDLSVFVASIDQMMD